MIFQQFLTFFAIFSSFVSVSSAGLDLSHIKQQQTYPANGITTVSTAAGISTTPGIPTTTTGVSCNVGCEIGWLPYSGKCYKMIAKSVNRADAEAGCVGIGAHLTSFESLSEATAIQKLLLNTPLFSTTLTSWISSSKLSWIGLSKPKNGAWSWADSSDVNFMNLPTGYTSSEASCTVLNNSMTWQPTKCGTTAKSFICKKAATF